MAPATYHHLLSSQPLHDAEGGTGEVVVVACHHAPDLKAVATIAPGDYTTRCPLCPEKEKLRLLEHGVSSPHRMPMACTSEKAELNVRANLVEVGIGDTIGEANGDIFLLLLTAALAAATSSC